MGLTILDGPMGTALGEAGVAMGAPQWSAHALETSPETVSAVHRRHAAAGAHVLTANTFRTTARAWGSGWADRARQAVMLARAAAPQGVRVAGSIAPLEDCYRPELSPIDPGREHAETAAVLHEAGCDLLLCVTFPHEKEALAAVRAAVGTGRPTWLALTAGPGADLLTPRAVGRIARKAVDEGASAVLVNCIPASQTLAYVQAIAGCGVPFGAYANAGSPREGMGWGPAPEGDARYLGFARTWVDVGATLIGSCCGTTPSVTSTLARHFGRDGDRACAADGRVQAGAMDDGTDDRAVTEGPSGSMSKP
ncbi:MAG: homocysteine S-methyltransferase family protein [Myxococcota bacterium]|nr:homocysteine S-methyltransferase family protein [Myxococcota bacterium]